MEWNRVGLLFACVCRSRFDLLQRISMVCCCRLLERQHRWLFSRRLTVFHCITIFISTRLLTVCLLSPSRCFCTPGNHTHLPAKMVVLSLKICVRQCNVVKTMQFEPCTAVYDACRIIRERVAEAQAGQGESNG